MAYRHNPELEAAILADPDDDDGYLVYADWLQSVGDPRGELIAVEHRTSRPPGHIPGPARNTAPDELPALRRREFLRATFACQLVHPLAVDHALRLRWRLGFVVEATLDVVQCHHHELWPSVIVERLLAHPACRLLRTITIDGMNTERYDRGRDTDRDADRAQISVLPDLLQTLQTCDWPPGLTGLALHASRRGTIFTSLDQLTALYQLPFTALSLYCASVPEGGVLALDRLRVRELELRVIHWSESDWSALGAVSWPRLERLQLSMAHESMMLPSSLTSGSAYPELRHLAIWDARHTAAVLAEIMASPLSESLQSLDGSFYRLSPTDDDPLVTHAGSLGHLTLFPTGDLDIEWTTSRDSAQHRRFIELAARMDRLQSALALYERALDRDPHLPLAWLARAWILQHLGRAREARACHDEMVRIDPHRARDHSPPTST